MASGTYATTSLQAALVSLANRLADPSMIRWVAPELTLYFQEAIRTWNALTETFRDTGTFSSFSTNPFYDLGVVLSPLRALTVTDQALITQIQYALLEPATGSSWAGTSQFALSDLTEALSRRRDQFLLETQAIVTEQVIAASSPPDSRVLLPENFTLVRRAAWITAPEVLVVPLLQDDEWALNHFNVEWPQSPTRPPQVYSVGVTPPLILQLAPPPVDAGTLDLITVNQGPVLNPSAGPTVLGIPDDWAWVVKFGALADLLSRDGLAPDPVRATYCEQRFRQGITLAKSASIVLAARVNNVPCLIDSIPNADLFSPLWQTVPGQVNQVLTLGHNLVALSPPPGVPIGGGSYSIRLDVVRNAPVPIALTDFIQLGSEVLDVITDYAVHLALFKEGGQQTLDSQPLLDRFFRAAQVAVDQNRAAVPNRLALLTQTPRASATAATVRAGGAH
jgi:hypothetical protein